MKYQATIHTMEIQPILPKEYEGKPGQWVHDTYQKNHPCITSLWTNHNDRTARAIINTHRLRTTPEGKYIFTYAGLPEHMRDMETICADLGIDGYIIRRMDVCLDADAPYQQTQKLTRLIALMLGERFNMQNRYISTDPLTGEAKTLRLDNEHRSENGNKVYASLQIEHYNRELKDQRDYAGKPIINRFELRSMGSAAGRDNRGFLRTEGHIAGSWLERLDGLTEADMQQVCHQLNEMLVDACGRYMGAAHDLKETTAMHEFLRVYAADYIYTRKQLVDLLDMLGIKNPDSHANNLITRSGDVFKLFKMKHVQAEIDRMKAALMGFLGQGKKHQI